jgi:CBS domain-containing protein
MEMKETRISEILQEKGEKTITVTPDMAVSKAVKVMADNKIGAVLVVDKERLTGILSERDCAHEIILKDLKAKETSVKDVMTPKVVFVTPDTSVEEGLAIMTERRCRHLPVLDNKKLIGIVSMGDLVRRIIKDQKVAINYLTEYIALSY